ncbi:MAG: methionine synthase [Christensenellaceae bacterium]|jgi:5-methyltetrahydrofolate--homocysteine methyltransferase|nr:methionine synthase [Christensenellaceae bacterium]
MRQTVELNGLQYAEAIRYLGYGDAMPGEDVLALLRAGEQALLAAATPQFAYRVFSAQAVQGGIALVGTQLILRGNSILEHLAGCDQAALLCATLGAGVDALTRTAQVRDMAQAVVLDALGSAAVEQVCARAEEHMRASFPNRFFTYRFGLGYGDLPLAQAGEFFQLLDASRALGVAVTAGNSFVPRKTVACVIGMSEREIQSMRKGCATCNLRKTCGYRARGDRCGY